MDAVLSALPKLRLMAEALMTDTCEVKRLIGQEMDFETGLMKDVWETSYSGQCKVQTSGGVGGDIDGANLGAPITQWNLRVDFPWKALGLGSDMVCEIKSSEDETLVGNKYRLVNRQSEKSHATAQRWNVREEA